MSDPVKPSSETSTPSAPAPDAAPAVKTEAAPSDWMGAISDEGLRSYIQGKGFKDAGVLAEGYRNLEKLRGYPEERLLKIPEKAEDKEGWSQVFKKLGMPDKPEGYSSLKAEKPEAEAYVKAVQGIYHEAGLTAKQAEVLTAKYDAYVQGVQKSQDEQKQMQSKQADEALKKEWGSAFDQNVKIGKQAAKTFGLTEEVLNAMEQAMGFSGAMKLFHNIGSKLGEGDFVTGSHTGSSKILSPEAARVKRSQLLQDKEFGKRLLSNDVNAKAEWDNIHKWMSPEPDSAQV